MRSVYSALGSPMPSLPVQAKEDGRQKSASGCPSSVVWFGGRL